MHIPRVYGTYWTGGSRYRDFNDFTTGTIWRIPRDKQNKFDTHSSCLFDVCLCLLSSRLDDISMKSVDFKNYDCSFLFISLYFFVRSVIPNLPSTPIRHISLLQIDDHKERGKIRRKKTNLIYKGNNTVVQSR